MGKKAFLLIVLLALVAPATVRAATITWACLPTAPARDGLGNLLRGTSTFGTPDLSKGALVQLWLAVGYIDDPRGVVDAWQSTDWHIDDVLLAESHIGFGTALSDAGIWSQEGAYDVNEGDIVYVRAYNLPKAEWMASPLFSRDLGVRNSKDDVAFQMVGDVRNPQTLYFDNLRLEVPEPSALLLLLPGLVVWKMKRRR